MWQTSVGRRWWLRRLGRGWPAWACGRPSTPTSPLTPSCSSLHSPGNLRLYWLVLSESLSYQYYYLILRCAVFNYWTYFNFTVVWSSPTKSKDECFTMFLTPGCSKHLVLCTVSKNCQVLLCDCLFIIRLTNGQMNTCLTGVQTYFTRLWHTFLYLVVTDYIKITQFQHTYITIEKVK